MTIERPPPATLEIYQPAGVLESKNPRDVSPGAWRWNIRHPRVSHPRDRISALQVVFSALKKSVYLLLKNPFNTDHIPVLNHDT
jgi:hypothetical protein